MMDENAELKRIIAFHDANGYFNTPSEETAYKLHIALTTLMADNAALTAEVAALREADRWIPVTERLPKRGESVLTYTNRVNTKIRENYRWITFPKTGGGREEWIYEDELVTHWKPLPSAPQEGE